jgi:hypothetical protein
MKNWTSPPTYLVVTFLAAHILAAFVIWRDVFRYRENRWTWLVAFASMSIFTGFGLYLCGILLPIALYLYHRDRNDLLPWDSEVLAVLSLAFQGGWVLMTLDGYGVLRFIGKIIGIKGAV